MTRSDPHAGQPVRHAGAALTHARLVVVLVHGRGASADDMLSLAGALDVSDVAYVAPEAAGHTWYPHSFLAPVHENEPFMSSALARLETLVTGLLDQGIGADRLALGGFSQGACLTLEFVARHPREYRAVFGLSGGLIGPPGTPREYEGSLSRTAVFLGCSDIDAHIPLDRVHETADVFRRMHASVDLRVYPQMGHTVNRDELEAVRGLLG